MTSSISPARPGILQRGLASDAMRALDQFVDQRLELRTGQFQGQVVRTAAFCAR